MSEASAETGQPRVSGKMLAPIFFLALLGAVGVALVTFWTRKDPFGPVLAVAPVDEERAMVLRRGYEERGYIHLALLVAESGEQPWSEALFGVQDPPALVVAGDDVFVRAREARGHAELHVFDIESGEFRWRGEPPLDEPVSGFTVMEADSLLVGDEVVYDLHGVEAIQVLVHGRSDGELRARVALDAPAAPVRTTLDEAGALVIVFADAIALAVAPDGSTSPTSPPVETAPRVAREGDHVIASAEGTTRWVELRDAVGPAQQLGGTVWIAADGDALVLSHPGLELLA